MSATKTRRTKRPVPEQTEWAMANRRLLEAYFDLHDRLSDLIEDGDLTEEKLPPGAYKFLADQLEKCAGLEYLAEKAEQKGAGQ